MKQPFPTGDIIRNHSVREFEKMALEIFRFQAENNEVYHEYLRYIGIGTGSIERLSDIPFLPARLFKTRRVICGHGKPGAVFTSSTTTGAVPSRHEVRDLSVYRRSLISAFERIYGPVEDWCILALLPSYLERKGSSLVFMVREWIERSRHPQSGFFSGVTDKLTEILIRQQKSGEKTLLLGVSFALLDLAEKGPFGFSRITVMETGGMKGRRREMTRQELHGILKRQLGIETVHSEYGMTELLSQAYSTGNGLFYPPPWMGILIRDRYDPFAQVPGGATGGINIIDLANVNSCSFIETDDLGRRLPGGGFEVLGRYDQSEIRGCNLMAG